MKTDIVEIKRSKKTRTWHADSGAYDFDLFPAKLIGLTTQYNEATLLFASGKDHAWGTALQLVIDENDKHDDGWSYGVLPNTKKSLLYLVDDEFGRYIEDVLRVNDYDYWFTVKVIYKK